MTPFRSRQKPLNPLVEHSLLSAEAVSKWAGFSIGWVEAPAEVSGRCDSGGQTVLALLDSGRAQAEFCHGNRSHVHDLQAGAMGLFVPDAHADFCHWRCDGVRRIMVQFDHLQLNDPLLTEQFERMPLHLEHAFRDDDLAAVLRAMAQEVRHGCPSGALYAESLSIGVATRLLHRAARSFAVPRERGKLTGVQARRVSEQVRERVGHHLSIEDLAQSTGFSKTQFVRLFKNTFGCTPHQYIVQVRLAHARAHIVGSDQSLSDIAEAAGFSSQSHMTTAFMRVHRTTPGSLRRPRST